MTKIEIIFKETFLSDNVIDKDHSYNLLFKSVFIEEDLLQ